MGSGELETSVFWRRISSQCITLSSRLFSCRVTAGDHFRLARHSGTITKVSGKATPIQAEAESGPSPSVAKA